MAVETNAGNALFEKVAEVELQVGGGAPAESRGETPAAVTLLVEE